MMLITRVRRNGTVDLLIVLAEENIERIHQYDPVEIIWSQMPSEISMRRPATLAVTYASAEEQKQIEQDSISDPKWKEKWFDKVTRGWKFRLDKGDHDFGPTVLGEPTKGTKQ